MTTLPLLRTRPKSAAILPSSRTFAQPAAMRPARP
ncbi:hypothetical protein RKD45_004316 [Streptomyces griseus]